MAEKKRNEQNEEHKKQKEQRFCRLDFQMVSLLPLSSSFRFELLLFLNVSFLGRTLCVSDSRQSNEIDDAQKKLAIFNDMNICSLCPA